MTPFSIRIKVRSYELDALGHLNQAVYHQYAEVARIEMLAAAGCEMSRLIAERKAPVLLESHINYRRELRGGDEVDVDCVGKFGTGKTFRMDSRIVRTDGTLAAEISCTVGLMDLRARRLLADPLSHFVAAGADPSIISG